VETLAQSARIAGLDESALAAPAASFGGEEFYTELAEKAAVLCSHLVRNHPLPDGKKRTAYLCLIEFIERNGYQWRQSTDEAREDEIVDTMVHQAAGQLSDGRRAAIQSGVYGVGEPASDLPREVIGQHSRRERWRTRRDSNPQFHAVPPQLIRTLSLAVCYTTAMSKRLQIVVDDEEARRYERCAKAEGLTLSSWARQALRAAEREVSVADPGRKLTAIRTAYEHAFPAPDIATMLAEIERGYGALDPS
jgi:death-on-curing protein